MSNCSYGSVTEYIHFVVPPSEVMVAGVVRVDGFGMLGARPTASATSFD